MKNRPVTRKISKKEQRDAAKLCAACILATIDGMIGAAPKGMLTAMLNFARDLERQGGGGTREIATEEMFSRPVPTPELPIEP